MNMSLWAALINATGRPTMVRFCCGITALLIS
jgi:hypothetical protein